MKYWKRPLAVILIFTALAGIMMSSSGALVAGATTTQQQIDQTNKEKNELENKLDKQQDNIDGLNGEKKTLQGELKNLNTKLTEVSENLEDLEQKINTKEQEIAETQAALEKAIATEQWQYDGMVTRVQKMYESNSVNIVNALMMAGSFADLLNLADWFEEIVDYDRKKLTEFQEIRDLVEQTKEQLQEEKISLDNLKVQAEAEKSKVSGLISQTAGSISNYTSQIAKEEEKAREYEAQIKQKEEDLEYLKQKLKEEMALSQAAANASWRDISEVQFSEGDRKILANLIYCEAGAESYDGQLAVASVVINRVLSSKYPDTVIGVVYQKSQFTPVKSGRLDLAITADRATASCYKAADEAMSGVTNVGTCVYFRTPIEGLTGINIGGHVFY